MYGDKKVPFKLMSKAQKKERIKYLWDLVRENIDWQEGKIRESILDAQLNRSDTMEIKMSK